MTLGELLGWGGPLTHRQYLAWQAWLDIQYDTPSRTDHYLMALTLEVRSVAGMFSKERKRWQMKDVKLNFGMRPKSPVEEKKQLDAHKALWDLRMSRKSPLPSGNNGTS
jgi:hypothetical protein